MRIFALSPERGRVGIDQQPEMLGDRLPRPVEVRAQFTKRLSAALVQRVGQLSPTFVRQRLEYGMPRVGQPAT